MTATEQVRGYIFDYGATLDTGGNHWGQVLWHCYSHHDVPVTEEQFRESYVYAERTLGSHPIIQSDYTFRKTLDTKIGIELDFLCEKGYLNADSAQVNAFHQALLNDLYAQTEGHTSHSKQTLLALSKSYPLALVSNFYGNINVILKEFGLDRLFVNVTESAVVGIRKPDERIFGLGVRALSLRPEEVVVVGDSFDKDILPAKKIGCKTVWFKGETWKSEHHDESVPDAVITDINQLMDMKL
jgi:HAD superfamily hydrolase (TIGR01509 family)